MAFILEIRGQIDDLLFVRRQGRLREQLPQRRIAGQQLGGFGHMGLEVGDEDEGGFDGAERRAGGFRSEGDTSELMFLMRISYAAFCLQKKNFPGLTED